MCSNFQPILQKSVKKKKKKRKSYPTAVQRKFQKDIHNCLVTVGKHCATSTPLFITFTLWPSWDPYGTNNNIESSLENTLAGSARECVLFELSISPHPNEFWNILPSCQQRYLVWAQGASRVAVWPAPTTMAACPASRDSSCIWRESGWSKSACAWLPAPWAFTAHAPQRETHAQVRHDAKPLWITCWISEGTREETSVIVCFPVQLELLA